MKKALLTILAVFTIYFGFTQDWSKVEQVFGKKGTITGNVFKVSYPRSDLKVMVGDFHVAPGLALGSWIGIYKMGEEAMMMGDLVLLDSEVPSVIAKLVGEKLQVTAIHNHLINESPNVKYVHFSGSGDAVKLAEHIKAVLSITGTPLGAAQPPAESNIDWSKVEAVLGTSGKHNGMLLQYSFPRKEKLKESGMEMPAAMGMATAINFQMDGERAGITGDYVMLANEVDAVVRALTENGITVTAIHSHMLHDEPRLFMLHFWAVGDPGKLAKGLKAALDKTNSGK